MIRSYARYVFYSAAAVSVSWILCFLMVLDIISPSFWLITLTYGLAIIGLFVGLLIAFNIFQIKKNQGEKGSANKNQEGYSPFYSSK